MNVVDCAYLRTIDLKPWELSLTVVRMPVQWFIAWEA